ncbi:hypothetical protein [Botrimarina sp.]|uniref:hypothetical protein n=1 Tax=Botrimarina sp. TaxID=2795802 RepID=UPI0032EE2858
MSHSAEDCDDQVRPQRPRVGIVGYYRRLNLGDDLMAVMIARMIERAGGDALIHGNSPVFIDCGCECEQNLETFCKRVDCILVGGGGVLLPLNSPNPNAVGNEYSTYLLSVVRFAESLGIRLHVISIGGDSADVVRPLRPGPIALLTSPNFRGGTYRLRQDRECLEHLTDAAMKYCPDIVLDMPRWMPFRERESHGQLDLAFQISDLKLRAKLRRLRKLRIIPKYSLVDTPASSMVPDATFAKFDPIAEEMSSAATISEAIELIALSKAYVCNRLHVGVIAAAIGRQFLALTPQKKVACFFEDLSLDLEKYVVPPNAVRSVPLRLTATRAEFTERISRAAEDSRGHADYIQQLVSGYHVRTRETHEVSATKTLS